MKAHTPGPWADDRSTHDAPYQDIDIKAGSRIVCTIWIDDAPVHDFNAEQNANSRLIKSAPELLDALELILSAEDRGFGMDYVKGCARAAIAKARGNT